MDIRLETIIKSIIDSHGEKDSLCIFDISQQFKTDISDIQKLNAAFLIALSGNTHPFYTQANTCLSNSTDPFAEFLRRCLLLIENEIDTITSSSEELDANLSSAADFCTSADKLQWNSETQKAIWRIFFPEGLLCLNEHDIATMRLREKRKICVTQLNPKPLSEPANEILFSSNILLTVPASKQKLATAGLPAKLTQNIIDVLSEKQLYWFDHPIQIGVETDKNEIIYGLRGLNDTCVFEKKRGTMKKDAKISCVLSVSVTHQGLHRVTKEYLEAEFAKIKPFDNLDVYIFTENETSRLINEVLSPAAAILLPNKETEALKTVFGVDGEYGRHYSFLKAISALWQVLVNKDLKATFKIDLDQVFPEDVLVKTTGKSAFEHYMTPLWGATGTDSSGNNVELGMIAGALVNESDISKGLFTPDVLFPEKIPAGDGTFFMSALPMALSTEAEMGTRYNKNTIDGVTACIQRVHVTGGTNGILIDSLRKYRPFTPSFIGRAEDQAYLMSILFSKENMNLRYVHCDGLIMRHDKHAFAGESIEAAKVGRQTGDLARILYFSSYTNSLPWPVDKIKNAFDPFTGCFISKMPLTVVMMRLCVSIAEMFERKDPLTKELADVAAKRINEALDHQNQSNKYNEERSAWDLYYDILAAIEHSGPEINSIRSKALSLIEGCLIKYSKQN